MLLYNLLIGPLELIMEFFFKLVQVITGNIGIAVLSLSIIVTFLTLPLYMVAENWQEKERLIQNKLKPGIDRIKLYQRLKSSDAFGHPEVIVVTGMNDEETEKKCRELGVKYFFRKPVFIPELIKVITTIFN